MSLNTSHLFAHKDHSDPQNRSSCSPPVVAYHHQPSGNRVSDSVDRSEEEFADEDEDSVNIDDVGYEENRDSQEQKLVNSNNNNCLRNDPSAGYSGFAAFPYPYPEDTNQRRGQLTHTNCDSDRNQGAGFSELGHFSAFRYLHQQNQQQPGRQSPEFGYTKGYPVKDSVAAESPENLCGGSGAVKASELYSVRHSNPPHPAAAAMLEHKLPFNFLGPPLAALHSMTEMKSSLGGGAGGGDSNNNSTSAPSMSSPNAGHTAQTMHGQANAPNPHGIDTILSRPPPVTSAGLSSLTAGQ